MALGVPIEPITMGLCQASWETNLEYHTVFFWEKKHQQIFFLMVFLGQNNNHEKRFFSQIECIRFISNNVESLILIIKHYFRKSQIVFWSWPLKQLVEITVTMRKQSFGKLDATKFDKKIRKHLGLNMNTFSHFY